MVAILHAAFKNGESANPNVKHFTIEFDAEDVNNDSQYVVTLASQS